MRHDPVLAAWLDDTGAHGRGRLASAAAAAACRTLPVFRAFAGALAAAPAGDAGADAADAAAARLIADDGWPAALVALLMEALADDAFFVPPHQSIESGLHHALVLHDDARATVTLGVGSLAALARHKAADGGRRALIFSGQRGHVRFLRAGGATIRFHHLGQDGRPAPGLRRRLRDGDMVAVDGRHTSWVVEHATGDMVLAQAVLKDGRGAYLREFSAAGDEVARSTTDEAASRAQMLLSLLAAMDRPGAAEAIAPWLSAPEPFLRWHALRELAALDPVAASPHLAASAADDPDEEVRGAATATLALLGPPCRG